MLKSIYPTFMISHQYITRLLAVISCLLFVAPCLYGQTVFISEIVASNDESLLDEDGDSSDWIELYNSSGSDVTLTGWHLTDDAENLTQWTFPATVIPANSFLIVFASDKNRAVVGQELHTNFKLSASGDYLALVQANGTTIENDHTFGAQFEDTSYGYTFAGGNATVLLDAGASCTAYIPTNSSDATDWKDLSFSDSGWLSGTTGVGYEFESGYENLIGLDTIAMKGVNATMYIRVPFTASDTATITSLTLKMKYDDGFIAYMNGVEVASTPNVPAEPLWNSSASSFKNDTQAVLFETFDLSDSISALQDGNNILAIHGLNVSISSSDMLIVPRLEAAYASAIDSAEIGLRESPTPNSANTGLGYAGFVDDAISVSPARGFYSSTLTTVTLTNPTAGAEIRYTTDGSEPTTSSALYTAPITISTTTTLRSKAFKTDWKPSLSRTDTYIFAAHVAAQPKTTDTINGQALEYGMDADVLAETYRDDDRRIITVESSLKAIPSISLTTAYENLYDPTIGIYVNAQQRWEVPASVELIYPDGTEGFQVNAGLRIRGGASRSSNNPKHSFRLLFNSDYGYSKLKYALFEDEGVDEFDKIDLRSAQNYSWSSGNDSRNTFLRDVFARDSAAAMGQSYTRSRYYHLYVNGEYWGLFMTEERPVADFAASYHGGDKDDYDALKAGGTDRSMEPTDGNREAFERLYDASIIGFSDNADYLAVQGLDANGNPDPTKERLLDVDNMIDYLLVIYYMAASDNCITWFAGGFEKLNNIYAFYNRANPDGFKWIQHDSEHSLDTNKQDDMTGPFPHENFETAQYFNPMTLHERLSVNEEYKIKFADRVYKHLQNGGAMTRANAQARLDDRAAQIDHAIVANAARWGSTSLDRDTWVSAVATTRAWLTGAQSGATDRCAVVIDYLDADGLIPSITPPLLNRASGLVESGSTVSIRGSNVIYTIDGTDPRAVGGGIAGSSYTGAITITRPTHLKARARSATGEWSALAERTYWTADIPLAVTELMYHAPEGNSHDLIEIQNISSESVSLKGYKLDDGIEFKFKNSAFPTLAPSEIMVVVDDIDAFNEKYIHSENVLIAGEFSGDLSNSGEELDLEFRGEDLITFTYDDARNWPQSADGAGHSLVPLDSAIHDQERGSLNYGGNWRASTHFGGSPGESDPTLNQTVMLNEVIAHTDTGDSAPFDSNDVIELYNPTGSAIDLTGYFLSDNLNNPYQWAIPYGTTIPAYGFIAFDEDDYHTDRINGFGLNKAGEEVVLSTTNRVVDSIRFKGQENGASYGRYPDGSAHWMLTEPTRDAANSIPAPSIEINEIMYHPLTPGDDYEYVILKNVSSSSITLQNATGNYRIDGDIDFDFPTNTQLKAGDILWLVSFDPAVDTALLTSFASTYGITPANESILGPYSGNLSNSAGRIAIERPQDSDDPLKPLDVSWVVVDEVYYADQYPWSPEADGTGFPLVRTGLNTWGALTTDDMDADGMNDTWETTHFGSLTQANIDWDDDGFSNYAEYIADTDPTEGASHFKVSQSNAANLSWSAKPGRIYSVYWTDDLTTPFQLIATGITSGSYIDTAHLNSVSNFYYITVEFE